MRAGLDCWPAGSILCVVYEVWIRWRRPTFWIRQVGSAVDKHMYVGFFCIGVTARGALCMRTRRAWESGARLAHTPGGDGKMRNFFYYYPLPDLRSRLFRFKKKPKKTVGSKNH